MRTLVAKLADYFRLHTGVDLSRDRLADEVWGLMLDPRSRCIDQTVAELRRHLEPPERIVTVYRVGYRYQTSPLPFGSTRGEIRSPVPQKKNPASDCRV